jgi:predicted phosphoribosyltransferase
MFRDRRDAGERLAKALERYKGLPVVVYALPRGGVVVAAEVARGLEAPLDLIVVRKIGHPQSPEYAIGAVAEDGYVLWNLAETASMDPRRLDLAASSEWKEAERRRKLFLGGRSPVPVKGKTAIIVDDGLATGLTMEAAIYEIRKRHPSEIVVAVPVAARDSAGKIGVTVDDLVALQIPDGYFGAIGSFYRDFEPVGDDEVIAVMESFSNQDQATSAI